MAGHSLWALGFRLIPVLGMLCFSSQAGDLRDLSFAEQDALAQRFRPFIKTTGQENLRPADWKWFVNRALVLRSYAAGKSCAGQGTADNGPTGEVMRWSFCQGNTLVALIPPDGLTRFPCANLTADCVVSSDVVQPPSDSPVTSCPLAPPSSPDPTSPPQVRDLGPSGTNDVGYALYLKSPADRAGEDWNAVIQNGDGLYAHVQEIGDANGNDTNLVNIEYSILWAYNDGFCSQHHGDITSIVVVYDRAADRVTRVSYSIHGLALLMFRTALPDTLTAGTLPGTDAGGAADSIPVVALDVSGDDQLQRGDHFTAGDARVYFARDPVTGLFEHPVVFAENNAHELWPNKSGTITEAASHDGDGVSFLPSKVQVLGTLEQPAADQAAFLYFNGKFGTDPQSIALHRTWLWRDWTQRGVAGSIRIPDSRFTDKDPYCRAGDSACAAPDRLTWPPAREFVDASPQLFIATGPNLSARFDNSSAPFHDIYSALSFAPCGGRIVLSPGNYAAPVALSRACGGVGAAHGIVLSAAAGPVTLRNN